MTQATHYALVRRDAMRVGLERVPTDQSPALLVRMVSAGICGTDLQILNGDRPDTAAILGHEGAGRVVAVADNVRQSHGFRPGDWVMFNPVNQHDQHEILGHSVDGLFQEYVSFPQRYIEAGMVLPLRVGMNRLLYPLVEPLATAIYGHELVSERTAARRVAVVGAGPVGVLNAFYAQHTGAEQVFVINRSAPRLSWIQSSGILPGCTLLLDGPDVAAQIRASADDSGVDAIYLCVNRNAAVGALERVPGYAAPGACVDLVCSVPENRVALGLSTGLLADVRRRHVCGRPSEGADLTTTAGRATLRLTGHRGTSPHHLRMAAEVLSECGDQLLPLITHRLTLETAAEALAALAGGRSRQLFGRECMKAVIDFAARPNVLAGDKGIFV
jgi:threonine dehydrogenase-like Zn-dependent dehydrogenase